jgi:hypothetical protein
MKNFLIKLRDKINAFYAPILKLPYGDKIAHGTGGVVSLLLLFGNTNYVGMVLSAWFAGYVWEFLWRFVRDDEVSHLDALAVALGGAVISLPFWLLGVVPFTY